MKVAVSRRRVVDVGDWRREVFAHYAKLVGKGSATSASAPVLFAWNRLFEDGHFERANNRYSPSKEAKFIVGFERLIQLEVFAENLTDTSAKAARKEMISLAKRLGELAGKNKNKFQLSESLITELNALPQHLATVFQVSDMFGTIKNFQDKNAGRSAITMHAITSSEMAYGSKRVPYVSAILERLFEWQGPPPTYEQIKKMVARRRE